MERLTFKAGGFNAFNNKGLCTYGGMQKDGSVIYIGDIADKLADLEDLEEQGLLLKLPCKVGDTAYRIDKNNKKLRKCDVEAIYCGAYGTDNKWHIKIDSFHYDFSDFGKTVFLTQAEAEEALKGMESVE